MREVTPLQNLGRVPEQGRMSNGLGEVAFAAVTE